MKILNLEQGSPEWIAERAKRPTASQFHRILTPKTMRPSAQRIPYMSELLAEQFTGQAEAEGPNEWMLRGTHLENEARAWYQFVRNVDVVKVGHCVHDGDLAGCSPDGLVGDAGGLEIKCLSARNHVLALISPDDEGEYICQIQGSLWITGREWWDRVYYSPVLPPIIKRIRRNEQFISAMESAVQEFVSQLACARDILNSAKGRGAIEIGTEESDDC